MAPKEKVRLDILVLERGLASSRHQAQGLILSGRILVDDVPFDKPGVRVAIESEIRLKGSLPRYVSRGGEKLAGALRDFDVDVSGVVALDVGASTGGFTDCLLQAGAAQVYAVDVGFNQLAHSVRCNPRVRVMEKLNAKELRRDSFDPVPNFVTMDVSFIGIEKIIAPVLGVCAEDCRMLLLLKPQFELAPEDIARGGVPRDTAKVEEAIRRVRADLEGKGLHIHGIKPAVLRGHKKGNQEYFVFAERQKNRS